MQHCIKISDANAAGVLEFDLPQLLGELPAEVAVLRWQVEQLDARWKTSEPDVVARLQRAMYRREALVLSWIEIVAAADAIFQTTDARIVAQAAVGDDPALALEAVDTSYWLVQAEDANLLGPLVARFRCVSTCD